MSGPPHASSWAAPPEFYIDENIAGRTIRRFISDLGYLVHTSAEVFGRARLNEGLNDEDWLPVVGRRGWVIFGRDHHILERQLELAAYVAAKVHMFLLPGQAVRADIIALLELNLAEVCVVATRRSPGVYWLTNHGVVDYERRKAERDKRRCRGR